MHWLLTKRLPYLKDLSEKAEAEGFQPTNCQLKAIEFLATTTDRVVGIQGYAGTGKTTMLQAVCEIAKTSGLSDSWGGTECGSQRGITPEKPALKLILCLSYTLAKEAAPEDQQTQQANLNSLF